MSHETCIAISHIDGRWARADSRFGGLTAAMSRGAHDCGGADGSIAVLDRPCKDFS